MSSSLRTSASGMIAQQRMIDVIANNLANVNTTAFKRSRVSFEDIMYETVQGPRITGAEGRERLGPVQVGKGVRVAGIDRLHSPGAMEATQRPLDLAVDGDGFFQVQRPDGSTAYTRDGGFTLSEAGTLVTRSGYVVLPMVQVPEGATQVTVTPNGTVTVVEAGNGTPVEIGRLEMVRFLNPNGLMAIGENQYTETAGSGVPQAGYAQDEGFGRIVQGMLESSNVEIVQEMTDMIAAQRAYEINARAIKVGEDMMRATSEIIR